MNKETRKSGASVYIDDWNQRNLTKECKGIGIADTPCYCHQSKIMLRPDMRGEEASNWKTHYEFEQCKICGWLVSTKRK